LDRDPVEYEFGEAVVGDLFTTIHALFRVLTKTPPP
jgi:hypothetical protein